MVGRRQHGSVTARLPALAVALALVLSWSVLVPRPSGAYAAHDPQDDILASIGVDEHPGAGVPLDAVFHDGNGATVRLRDFTGSGPVVLTLNYYTCPMLCPLTLRNLLGTAAKMKGVDLRRDFRIVTVSFDPDDLPETARARASEIHAAMGKLGIPASRWTFLLGDPGSIAALTSAVGYRYRKVGSQFAHPDANVVLTPDGKISRYLYGVQQSPNDLKLALIEAADGRIGKSQIVNRILLYCFHYDPVGKKYALYAQNIMKAGGVLTLGALGAVYLLLWKRRKTGTRAGGEGRG